MDKLTQESLSTMPIDTLPSIRKYQTKIEEGKEKTDQQIYCKNRRYTTQKIDYPELAEIT
jgi:hypothetical protein